MANKILKPIQRDEYLWEIPANGRMRVPALIYADTGLINNMDEKVFEQAANVASLPGIVKAAYAMPDAHWGYGFPIGGVAAFDPAQGGVVCAGGVGFDISCGVRTLHTGLSHEQLEPLKARLADLLFQTIPAGLGSTGALRLQAEAMRAMLEGGAAWAVKQGFGYKEDLHHIEEGGRMAGADPDAVSDQAKRRQRDEMGTLGSGNHYLEVQEVVEIFAPKIADCFGLKPGDILVSIHCGSRGLGHQIGTEFLRHMVVTAGQHGINLPDRELACAPLDSQVGRDYLGAMRAGINCALANRQILTHLARRTFERIVPEAELRLLYDVSHNTCKVEHHRTEKGMQALYIHRKGATRAFGPGHPDLPESYREVGQPVLIGGSMGTASYILCGTTEGEEKSFSSACHGAGRAMSRRAASKRWHGGQVVEDLARRGILIRSPSRRGVAEEAPGAYKEVSAVVDASDRAGLACKVAKLTPLICIKG